MHRFTATKTKIVWAFSPRIFFDILFHMTQSLSASLEKLDAKITELEAAGADIEKATTLYAQAIKLASENLKKINHVEKTITVLHQEATETLSLEETMSDES